MATCDFGPVTVISCERALFFVYIWIISWDATNRYSIKTIVKLHCHVDCWATDFRYVIQKFWGVHLFGEARVFGRILYIYIYISKNLVHWFLRRSFMNGLTYIWYIQIVLANICLIMQVSPPLEQILTRKSFFEFSKNRCPNL